MRLVTRIMDKHWIAIFAMVGLCLVSSGWAQETPTSTPTTQVQPPIETPTSTPIGESPTSTPISGETPTSTPIIVETPTSTPIGGETPTSTPTTQVVPPTPTNTVRVETPTSTPIVVPPTSTPVVVPPTRTPTPTNTPVPLPEEEQDKVDDILEFLSNGTINGQPPSEEDLQNLDFNGDGNVTSQDAQDLFLQLLLSGYFD